MANRPLAVLRPEPGNAATCARIAAVGATAVALPLFTVVPLAWDPPDAAQFDALVLTSANAIRHGGAALSHYRALPVFAVGEATAAGARAAGFAVAATGTTDGSEVAALLAQAGIGRALHLAGRDRAQPRIDGVAETIAVYASDASDPPPDALAALPGCVALLHSARAARRLAELVTDRTKIRIAAISDAALTAAGSGWAGTMVAAAPHDEALVAAALRLAGEAAAIDPANAGADKRSVMDEPTPNSSPTTFDVAPPRRRWRTIVIAVTVAFLLGLGAMTLLMSGYAGWFGTQPDPQPSPAAVAAQPAAPATFSPSAPLSASGAQTADLGQLEAREVALAGRIAELEARLANTATAAQSASGDANRAEGLLIAFAARRALDRGLGLGYIEGQLRERFGPTQPQSVATVVAASRQPVTLEDLREGILAITPQLKTGNTTDGWWASLRREVSDLIVVRRDNTPSPRADDRLVRARRMLDSGQVEGALAEVARLPGVEAGNRWIAAAKRYTEARRALDTIETAAILGQGRDPAARPAAPAPAAAAVAQ